VAGTCECGNEPSGSIKCGEFLDWLRNGQLLKKDSALWITGVCKEKVTRYNFVNIINPLEHTAGCETG
jgi:hypothetical protein